jgi:hypothetical protein
MDAPETAPGETADTYRLTAATLVTEEMWFAGGEIVISLGSPACTASLFYCAKTPPAGAMCEPHKSAG